MKYGIIYKKPLFNKIPQKKEFIAIVLTYARKPLKDDIFNEAGQFIINKISAINGDDLETMQKRMPQYRKDVTREDIIFIDFQDKTIKSF